MADITPDDLPPLLPGDPPPPADRPPRKTRARRATTARKPRAPRAASDSGKLDAAAKATIREGIAAAHVFIGRDVLTPAGRPIVGGALAQQGDAAGDAWLALAVRYPALAKWLNTGGDFSLWLGLGLAYYPIVVAAKLEGSMSPEQIVEAVTGAQGPEAGAKVAAGLQAKAAKRAEREAKAAAAAEDAAAA